MKKDKQAATHLQQMPVTPPVMGKVWNKQKVHRINAGIKIRSNNLNCHYQGCPSMYMKIPLRE